MFFKVMEYSLRQNQNNFKHNDSLGHGKTNAYAPCGPYLSLGVDVRIDCLDFHIHFPFWLFLAFHLRLWPHHLMFYGFPRDKNKCFCGLSLCSSRNSFLSWRKKLSHRINELQITNKKRQALNVCDCDSPELHTWASHMYFLCQLMVFPINGLTFDKVTLSKFFRGDAVMKNYMTWHTRYEMMSSVWDPGSKTRRSQDSVRDESFS